MSLFSNFNIAGSAMSAQTQRLNVVASNVANANVAASSPEEAYKSRMPVFQTIMAETKNKNALGVNVAGIVESDEENPMRYEPGNPMANDEGYVFMSNVNVVDEMVNMISASRSFQNNVEVLETTRKMLQRTLTMGE